MDYAWLGPVGELRQVPCPQAGVSVASSREASSFVALDGSRTDYMAARVHRSWVLSYTWKTPSVVSWLSELASGVVVGDTYLYTSVAARENLAPPQLQSGGSGVVAGRRVLAVGDPEVRAWVVPVRPNTTYTLSALGDGVGVVTVVAAGTPSNGFGRGPFGHGPFGE